MSFRNHVLIQDDGQHHGRLIHGVAAHKDHVEHGGRIQIQYGHMERHDVPKLNPACHGQLRQSSVNRQLLVRDGTC